MDFDDSRHGPPTTGGWDGVDRRTVTVVHEVDRDKPGVKFDKTINLGHVLTFAGFIIAGLGAWSTLDKRVTVLESQTALQAQVDKAQDQLAQTTLSQIRESLADIKSQLAYLTNRRSPAP